MNSAKHADKVRRSKNPNVRYFPYRKKGETTTKSQIPSLSSNFVSGGITYQP